MELGNIESPFVGLTVLTFLLHTYLQPLVKYTGWYYSIKMIYLYL